MPVLPSVPWHKRSRREQTILVVFFAFAFILLISITAGVVFFCVYTQNHKYLAHKEDPPKALTMVTKQEPNSTMPTINPR
ncbi:uncharacterized protein Dwil_GK27188 [Drosophila willistoni]|uniref:Uncharacterized protein n=1 Tax=Drosophila willistoni TaxID=7260 RepID=A0A0Q9X4H0_DROWI|nr:uncharacterized protein Dwil_GK27188 [Drosophila willistoni]